MRITFDTNVLVYAVSRREAHHDDAAALLHRAAAVECVQPMQTFGELFSVLTRKYRRPADEAVAAIEHFRVVMATATAIEPDFDQAMRLAARHQVPFWDALIWATARRAGSSAVLTQDLPGIQDLDGMLFVDPFHPESETMLKLLFSPVEHRS